MVKGYPKGSGTLPAPHPMYAAGKFLNGHGLKFCSPDSYNPGNSCRNKHCYIIMRISVVCPSRIGCRSVWLKGTPNGSGFTFTSATICYCKKSGDCVTLMKAAATVESSVSAVKLYPEEYSCNMYRMLYNQDR